MSEGPTVEFPVHFRQGSHGRKRLRSGAKPTPPITPERIPTVAKTMALAIRFDRLIREGVVRDYADLARLIGVSRARVSQIMDLLNLAPGIQEKLLFLGTAGEVRSVGRSLRGVVSEPDWDTQLRKLPIANITLGVK